MRRHLVLIGLLVAVLATGSVLAGDAAALQRGDTVTFLIPADANQPDPPTGLRDAVIFHRSVTTIDATGCATGSRPVQDATLIDPSGGESGRIEGLIIISEATPIPPGTNLTNVVAQTSCSIGTTTYKRYQGTVVR